MKKYTRFPLSLAAGLAIAAGVSMAPPAQAANEGQLLVGMLECDVEGGVGLILGSKKHMTCIFKRSDGSTENYTGRVTKIGLDIGVTDNSHIMWEVIAQSEDMAKGDLAGLYDGVGAEVTILGGVGANALVSGGKSFALQPFSVQGQEGLNIAGGLEQVKLEYVE